jgi:hypothetical protein
MLLILKIIKLFKKYCQSIVVIWQHMFSVPVMRTVWRRELELASPHSKHDEIYKTTQFEGLCSIKL